MTLQDRKKLVGICGLFGSSHDGERASAAAMADRLVRDRGLSWNDVLHAEPPEPQVVQSDRYWRTTAEQIFYDHMQALADWEARFLQDLLRHGQAPTAREAAVLRRIAAKTGVPQWDASHDIARSRPKQSNSVYP